VEILNPVSQSIQMLEHDTTTNMVAKGAFILLLRTRFEMNFGVCDSNSDTHRQEKYVDKVRHKDNPINNV